MDNFVSDEVSTHKVLRNDKKTSQFLDFGDGQKNLMSLFIGHPKFRTFCCLGQQQLTILTSKYKTGVKRLKTGTYIYLVSS